MTKKVEVKEKRKYVRKTKFGDQFLSSLLVDSAKEMAMISVIGNLEGRINKKIRFIYGIIIGVVVFFTASLLAK